MYIFVLYIHITHIGFSYTYIYIYIFQCHTLTVTLNLHTPRRIISWRNRRRKKQKQDVRSMFHRRWCPFPPWPLMMWIILLFQCLVPKFPCGVYTRMSTVIGCCRHGTPMEICSSNACCLQHLTLGRWWMGMTLQAPTFGVRAMRHPSTVQPSCPIMHLRHHQQPRGRPDVQFSRSPPHPKRQRSRLQSHLT